MSARSNSRTWRRAGTALALAVLMGGCSASGPARPDAGGRDSFVDSSEAASANSGPAPASSPGGDSADQATDVDAVRTAAAQADASDSGRAKAERRKRHKQHAEAGESAAVPAEAPEAAQRDYAAALAAMQGGNWADAEARLERMIADYPSLPGPYVNVAIVYVHDGRDDDALAALEKALAVAPGHVAANNELGVLLRKRGDFSGAEKAYRKALETEPNYPLALYNLAVLLDLYLRRQDEALALYERYQSTLATPDETVAGWIIDLKRRVGAARVAREETQ